MLSLLYLSDSVGKCDRQLQIIIGHISWIQNLIGLIELCKWRRNKEKVKKNVVDTNYYYNKDRDDEDYFENNITDTNDYYDK